MFIIFWILEAGILAFICLLALVLWLVGRTSDKSWLRCLSAVPVGGIALFLLLTLGGFVWSIVFPPSSHQRWKIAFGYAPPAGVSAMQSSEEDNWDSGVTYLKFQAPAAVIRKTTQKGWKRVALPDEIETSNGEPIWWKHKATNTTQYFAPQAHHHYFASEHESLAYEPSTRTAYYFYVGID